jgi:hypothetical protein
MAAFGRQVRLTAASSRANSGINVRYLLAKTSKERLPMLFHLVRRVTAYRVLIPLHLIDKTGAEPPQVVIG